MEIFKPLRIAKSDIEEEHNVVLFRASAVFDEIQTIALSNEFVY
jgi:hypothetical protein